MSVERAESTPALREPPASHDTADPEQQPIVPIGNRLRLRALPAIGTGVLVAFSLMAAQVSPRLMVPACFAAVLLATVGVLDLLGSFDDPEHTRAHHCHVSELALPLAIASAGLLAQLALVRAAVAGVLPWQGTAIFMPVAFVASVVGLYLAGERLGPFHLDEDGAPRPLWRRHGFWLVTAVTLLYLPMLGNHGLTDPWETHYGEVAREILARNDWISLWWAQDGWFWSKPVLSFWMQAAAMAVTGVRYEPGAMLSAAGDGLDPQPEWPLRMSVFVVTVLGVYLLYKGSARVFGRRAALLGALVLATMPQFFLIAHQTMTDMPFVAFMAAAVGLFLLAVHVPAEERARTYELRFGKHALRLSLFHVVIGAVVLLALPQILYLLSRNVVLGTDAGHWALRLSPDTFSSGSFGNCGLPGNEACRHGLRATVPSLEPAIQALVWAQMLALFLWMSWGERRLQRLLFLAAWLCAALSTMGKGPAGLLLPAVAAFAWVVATGRWRTLARMEIPAGLLAFCAVALPWGVAMYARHGSIFVDKLFFDHIVKRAFGEMHQTNRGDEVSFRYYVWQLGYAAFPWTGLAPFALVRWLREENRGRRFGAAVVHASWFLVGFVLFAWMGTKFHHYCLPILPPLAMLVGLLLDDMMRRRQAPDGALLGAVAVGAALVTLLVGRDLASDREGWLGPIRLMHLFTYNYERPWPASVDFSASLWFFAIAAALSTLLLAVERLRRALIVALSVIALVFAAWGIDAYLVTLSPHWGQRELLIAYERHRVELPGPLIAYQLNWKGENFYRGNEVPAWPSSGKKFQQWMDEQKKQGLRTFYFVLQHTRTRTLEAELGQPRRFEELTGEALNNKFVLVRVQFDS